MFKLVLFLAALSAVGIGGEMKIGFPMTERLSHKNPVYVQRITGGENARQGEFPHQITLQYNKSHICGGVIISNRTVLTAGHCIYGQNNFTNFEVLAGVTKLKSLGKTVQRNYISKAIVHPKYPGRVGPNDIAILTLRYSFQWTPYVQNVLLPSANEEFEGDTMLSGWGSTSRTFQPIFPDNLQKAKLPLISFKDCSDYFMSSPLNEGSNICTGPLNGDLSACSGDSGGPLIKEVKGKTYVVGLVSWGTIPCGNGSPTVYTKVSKFIDFINNYIE